MEIHLDGPGWAYVINNYPGLISHTKDVSLNGKHLQVSFFKNYIQIYKTNLNKKTPVK